MLKILPKPESLPTSLTVSILIHGSSIALITCFTGAIYGCVIFSGSVAHKILFKITKMPFPIISDTILSIVEKFPASIAVLLISLAFASCGGIALVLACFVYFILVRLDICYILVLPNRNLITYFLQLSKMYEDYLENFVFKTAKVIAMKLFGREKKSKSQQDNEVKPEKDVPSKDITKSNQIAEENNDNRKDDVSDEMLDEALEKLKEEKLKKDKELAEARIEYDSITEGLSGINFHLPLFLLLLVLTLLSTPSTVTWAKNYQFSKVLSPDPTLIPATCLLIALGFIWQLPTPRGL